MSEAADPNAKRRLRRLIGSFAVLVVGGVMYDAAMSFSLGMHKDRGWNAVAAEAVLGDYSDPNNRFAWNAFGLIALVLVAIGFLGTTLVGMSFFIRRVFTGRWT
jgi:hypothetical protein